MAHASTSVVVEPAADGGATTPELLALVDALADLAADLYLAGHLPGRRANVGHLRDHAGHEPTTEEADEQGAPDDRPQADPSDVPTRAA